MKTSHKLRILAFLVVTAGFFSYNQFQQKESSGTHAEAATTYWYIWYRQCPSDWKRYPYYWTSYSQANTFKNYYRNYFPNAVISSNSSVKPGNNPCDSNRGVTSTYCIWEGSCSKNKWNKVLGIQVRVNGKVYDPCSSNRALQVSVADAISKQDSKYGIVYAVGTKSTPPSESVATLCKKYGAGNGSGGGDDSGGGSGGGGGGNSNTCSGQWDFPYYWMQYRTKKLTYDYSKRKYVYKYGTWTSYMSNGQVPFYCCRSKLNGVVNSYQNKYSSSYQFRIVSSSYKWNSCSKNRLECKNGMASIVANDRTVPSVCN